jgi:DNA invertase Pin-like site-specific DNA recombinase
MDIDLTAKSDILHNPYFLVKLGRPNGSLGKSKLDGREDEIRRFLALDVSKASIAKITGVDRSTLYNFIRSRGIVLNS